MFDFSRGQLLAYAAVAAVLLAVGFSSLRGGDNDGQRVEPVTGAGAPGSRAGETSSAGEEGFGITGGNRRLVVDVAGAVNRPGVYRLTEGARVVDAIRKAGGPTRGAVVTGINRAARLADGQQVVVPSRTGSAGTGVSDKGGPVRAAAGSSAPISLGTATSEQLQQIDGIGPVTAEKIIEFRDQRGGLGSIEDLDQVSGIGPVTMEALRSALQP